MWLNAYVSYPMLMVDNHRISVVHPYEMRFRGLMTCIMRNVANATLLSFLFDFRYDQVRLLLVIH